MSGDGAPWCEEGVVVTAAALDAIDRDARERYARDEEACGYVSGPAEDALLCDEVVALENLANKLHRLDPETYFRTAREFFAFNEKRFDDAVRAGAANGRPVKVLYHSHVDVGAYFSATDAAVLSLGEPPAVEGGPSTLGPGPAWPLAFLVCAVERDPAGAPTVVDRRLYVWRDAAFVEAPLRVHGAVAS
ncbi:MAG: Mov34/MPN/PAD-1 family protein [Polyangiaceae bacterium]